MYHLIFMLVIVKIGVSLYRHRLRGDKGFGSMPIPGWISPQTDPGKDTYCHCDGDSTIISVFTHLVHHTSQLSLRVITVKFFTSIL